ncbi:hypothetical protein AsFPU1_3976 [Aphanothece sacrum FPU1]|uniref:ATP-dependent Zn protease n=2 Tax=Aphanothece sacrum TaxID=1122 RepID=A0A401IMT0_APHSA|nr:hypothetical protein AsFPU1_3976 [Aphanothece sacrum FPU1]
MMLSALLGPIFHLSPFIPAGTTLGILGLMTLDTLSWKGKGLTLLLDFFASAEDRQRIIHHEAGHFLAAYCLGIPINDYTLSAWEAIKKGQPGIGCVQFNDTFLAEQKILETPLIIERFSTVLMSGIAAEIVIYGQANGGEEDRQNLRELMIVSGINQNHYQTKANWSILQAKNLIIRNQETYEELVKMMEKRQSVADCYQLLQEKLKQN